MRNLVLCLGMSTSSFLYASESMRSGVRSLSNSASEKLEKIKSSESLRDELCIDGTSYIDAAILNEMAIKYDIPVAPIYLVADPNIKAPKRLEFIGIREGGVWQVRLEGKVMSMRKLGVVVSENDDRLRSLESSVLGSRSLIGFENPSTRELTAILQKGKTVVSVESNDDRTYSILPVGFSN